MENDYGVGVSNRYGLFLEDEEEDPFDMLSKQEQLKESKKKVKSQQQEKENRSTVPKPEGTKAKPAASVNKKPIKETQNLKPVEPQKSREEKPAANRPPRNPASVKFAPESREERNNRRNKDDRAGHEQRSEPRSYGGGESGPGGDVESRGTGRGGVRGVGRGSRGGRGGFRPSGERGDRERGERGGEQREFRPRREFDRHSGSDKSGVKAVDKREGGGARNWGTYRDEIQEQITGEAPEQLTPEKPAAEPAEETTGETTKEETPADENAANEAESVKELTLDEWKALRAKSQKPTFNIRKAGEGEDPTQWKKMYELSKKNDEEEDEDDEYEIAEYPQRVGRQKHLLDIDIHFSDARRGGRGRGGGRGGRGGRGGPGGGERGGPRRDGPPPPGVEGQERPERSGGGAGGERGERGERGPPRGSFPKPPGRGNFRQHQSAPKVDDEKDFPSLG